MMGVQAAGIAYFLPGSLAAMLAGPPNLAILGAQSCPAFLLPGVGGACTQDQHNFARWLRKNNYASAV